METKIFMHEEKIITQDDFDKTLYVILEGSASVYLRFKQEWPTMSTI
jgi:CRP-like cAMP-binding protein